MVFRTAVLAQVVAIFAMHGCADASGVSDVHRAPAALLLNAEGLTLHTGDRLQVRASLLGSDGRLQQGAVAWLSGDTVIAFVDGAGVVAGRAPGHTVVTAVAGGLQAQLPVEVRDQGVVLLASLSAAPEEYTISRLGGRGHIKVTALTTSGVAIAAPSVSWFTSDPQIATVDRHGTVTGVQAGSVRINAAASGISAAAHVTVAPSVHHVPAAIASNCSLDVTQTLHAWIASVPDNSTLVFGEGACYTINGGMIIFDRRGLTFEGNGSTFSFSTRGHSQRASWTLHSGSNLVFRNMTVVGANPGGGLAAGAYVRELEWQHGWRFRGTQGVVLDSVQVYDVYGDFVNVSFDGRVAYPGPPTRNVIVRNSRFERNGRYGLSVTHGENLVFENNYIGDVRWSAFNIELNHSVDVGRNIRIEGNRFGPALHHLFVAKGAGFSESVGNIVIRGNSMEPASMATCLAAITVATPGSDRFWKGWVIEDNVLRPRNGGPGIEMVRVRDLEIRNNKIISGPQGGCGSAAPITINDSHNGNVSGNVLIGPWHATHTVDGLTTGFQFGGNRRE
jgi:hypothetical protein